MIRPVRALAKRICVGLRPASQASSWSRLSAGDSFWSFSRYSRRLPGRERLGTWHACVPFPSHATVADVEQFDINTAFRRNLLGKRLVDFDIRPEEAFRPGSACFLDPFDEFEHLRRRRFVEDFGIPRHAQGVNVFRALGRVVDVDPLLEPTQPAAPLLLYRDHAIGPRIEVVAHVARLAETANGIDDDLIAVERFRAPGNLLAGSLEMVDFRANEIREVAMDSVSWGP